MAGAKSIYALGLGRGDDVQEGEKPRTPRAPAQESHPAPRMGGRINMEGNGMPTSQGERTRLGDATGNGSRQGGMLATTATGLADASGWPPGLLAELNQGSLSVFSWCGLQPELWGVRAPVNDDQPVDEPFTTLTHSGFFLGGAHLLSRQTWGWFAPGEHAVCSHPYNPNPRGTPAPFLRTSSGPQSLADNLPQYSVRALEYCQGT